MPLMQPRGRQAVTALSELQLPIFCLGSKKTNREPMVIGIFGPRSAEHAHLLTHSGGLNGRNAGRRMSCSVA